MEVDMLNRHLLTAMAGAFAILSACGAEAVAVEAGKSSYTSIAEKACRTTDVLRIADTDYAVSRICPGRGGYKVFIDEEDLRETLTIGKTLKAAAREPAARDRYGPFNAYEDAVEWRSGRHGRPFAVIVGWSYADSENTDATGRPQSNRLLVVMRLPPGDVCRVAVVDRAANRDANGLARKAADASARDFKCGTDQPQIIGERGHAIEAMPPARAAKP
jgi:hypothetical protein